MRGTSKTRARTAFVWAAGMAVLSVAFLGADGCAGNGNADPTPVQTFKITPAANATAPPEATTVTMSPTIPAPPDGAGAPQAVVIAAVGSTFDVEELEARAGSITVEFDNRDGGIIHNVHFFKGRDNDGDSVAESELEVGPIKQTLTFEVEPGQYFYQCDAHPTTMSGTLTVE